MPTLNGMDLPKPKNWQEFEDIALAALKLMWNSPTLQKNGRMGQKQAGVDIHGPDEIGRRVGVQCKRYSTLSLKLVEEEVANADSFQPALATLFVATTAEHDAKLQQAVRILSDKRVAAGRFAVGLLFWEDLVAGLSLNPVVLKSFYPQIMVGDPDRVDRTRLLAALELGFYGPYLWEYVILTFGEIGEMAQTEPEALEAVLRIVEERAAQLLSPTDASTVRDSVSEIRRLSYATKGTKEDWNAAEAHSRRIATRLNNAASLLPLSEGGMLNTGITLGRIEHVCDDGPSKGVADALKQALGGLLPTASGSTLRTKFRAAGRTRWGYQWANVIRSAVEREIRYGDWGKG